MALGASVFGLHFWDSIGSFLFLVTSAFSRRYFVEMLVIPWWYLYPWWPFVVFCDLDSLRGSSDESGTIQRRLAWPLRKDDTHGGYLNTDNMAKNYMAEENF